MAKLKVGGIIRRKDIQNFSYNRGGEICERLAATGYRGKPLHYVMLEGIYDEKVDDQKVTYKIEARGLICGYWKRDRQIACRGCPLTSGKTIRVSEIARKVQT